MPITSQTPQPVPLLRLAFLPRALPSGGWGGYAPGACPGQTEPGPPLPGCGRGDPHVCGGGLWEPPERRASPGWPADGCTGAGWIGVGWPGVGWATVERGASPASAPVAVAAASAGVTVRSDSIWDAAGADESASDVVGGIRVEGGRANERKNRVEVEEEVGGSAAGGSGVGIVAGSTFAPAESAVGGAAGDVAGAAAGATTDASVRPVNTLPQDWQLVWPRKISFAPQNPQVGTSAP